MSTQAHRVPGTSTPNCSELVVQTRDGQNQLDKEGSFRLHKQARRLEIDVTEMTGTTRRRAKVSSMALEEPALRALYAQLGELLGAAA